MKPIETIADELRAEAARLLELAERYQDAADLLVEPRRSLQGIVAPEGHIVDAPYGYKKDGTPRKRRRATNRVAHRKDIKKDTHKVVARDGVSLRVLSSTAPTEAELADRTVAHVTQEG